MKHIATTILASVLCATLSTNVSANLNDYPSVTYENQHDFIIQKIREHIGRDPLLEKIAGCESTGNPNKIKHWNKAGTLVKNPTSSASGVMQVLLQYHSDWIAQEGRNMQDVDDYMKFVKTLLKSQGYGAWNPSKHCWGKYQHLATN